MTHIFISGIVQHVGFRRYVRSKARKLNIKGWVTNLPDGRVEAVFDGDQENIKKMLVFCKHGPFLAIVRKTEIDENYTEEKDFIEFTIIW